MVHDICGAVCGERIVPFGLLLHAVDLPDILDEEFLRSFRLGALRVSLERTLAVSLW